MSDRTDILFPELEREMLRMGRVHEQDPRLLAQLDEGLRLAVLFSRGAALVPAPGYFETEAGFVAVRRFAPSVERGQLALLGSGGHPAEYVYRKLRHWADDRRQLDRYGEHADRRMATLDGQGWRPKQSSTDIQLGHLWQDRVESGDHPLLKVWQRDGTKATRAQDSVAALPESLEGLAIVVDNIAPRLPSKVAGRMTPTDRHDLRMMLAEGFFTSYIDDGEALALVDSRLRASAAIRATGVENVELHRLRLVLDGLRLSEVLLKQISHAALAELVDTPTWDMLRSRLLRRATADPAFSAQDLLALRRVGSHGTIRAGREVAVLERHLERQALALTRRPSRRPGKSVRSVRQLELFRRQGQEFMSGTHFHGDTTINGNVINLEGGARIDARTTTATDVLAAVLPEVFRASSPASAERLVESLDALMAGREVDKDGVAEIVRGDLADQVEKAHPAVRERLADLGTGATAGVIAQGVVLGIKALAGG